MWREVFWYEKGLRNSEVLCIHDGGDEGDRTPDLLTASQALSQLSYAPVTGSYYRGRSSGMQEIILETFSYGFSCDGAKIITLGSIIFARRPDKTLMQQESYCHALMDLNGCRSPDDVTDAGVG